MREMGYMSKIYGYVRVSSKDQNEGRQIQKLKELGIDEKYIFIDKQSGKDFDRPQYQFLRRIISQGDLIYIDALDRLGRDYDGIIREWKYITRDLAADIVILENTTLFDSRKFREMGDIGKLMEDQFLSLLSYVAEQERKKIRQRQHEGIALAKAEGRAYGRPKTVIVNDKFMLEYRRWKAGDITATEAIDTLGMSRSGYYRLVRQIEEQAAN
jgi:DNA invertase Pin-like site-specific DNA recombinase